MASLDGFESRIEQAFVWFQRIILSFLTVLAVLGGQWGEAPALAAIVALHLGIYSVLGTRQRLSQASAGDHLEWDPRWASECGRWRLWRM